MSATSVDQPSSADPSASEAWMTGLPEQLIPTQLGLVNIRVGGKPDGPPMVFWPSLLVDSSMWRDQHQHYAPTHRVVLIDPPGAGRSEPLRRTFELAECGDCLVAVLDALGIGRCLLVGTSWGALLGSVFAALHPERLDGAILINGSATPPSASEVAQMTELVTALEGMTAMPDWLVGATQSAFAGLTAETSKPEFMDYLRCVLREDPKSVAFAMRSVVIESKDRHALLRTIKDVPVLVLAGEEDRRFPVCEAQMMADAIPSSDFVVIPQTGHLAARETPDAVNRAIDAFIAKRSLLGAGDSGNESR